VLTHINLYLLFPYGRPKNTANMNRMEDLNQPRMVELHGKSIPKFLVLVHGKLSNPPTQ